MERVIKTLTKRDLKAFGPTGKFETLDVKNKLLEHFKNHEINTAINDILTCEIGVLEKEPGKQNIPVKKSVKSNTNPLIDEETFSQQHPNAIQVTEYGEWGFDNVFYDEDSKTFYEKIIDKGYKLKKLQTINRKESAVSVKDSSGTRRYIYIDKFNSSQ
jgi:hypothetical protein